MISVIDEFEIRGELGRGAMGVVYRAWDTKRRHEVALKVLAVAAQAQPDAAARFEQECLAASRLDHPNIVKVVRLGMHGRNPYMALELVEGQDLDERVRDRGPIEPEEAAELALQIASALSHAHERGVVHRDLKPANVVLHPVRGAMLTDFGLAKVFGTMVDGGLTRSSDLLGSPAYMAPEQATAEHERVGPRTDVYGLGATLYQMLTGKAPCWGDSLSEVMHAVVEVIPPPPSRGGGEIPPALDAICLRCLAKDPADRFPDAEAVRHALDAFLLAPHAAPGPDLPGWVVPVAAGLGLILLGVGFTLSWLLRTPPAPAATVAPLPPLPRSTPTPAFVPIPIPARDVAILDGTMSKSRLEQLLRSAEETCELTPDSANAHVDLARTQLALKRPVEAAASVTRALQLDPDLGIAHRTRGLIALRTIPADHKAAERAFTRALELDPRDTQALRGRGVARTNLKNYSAALDDFDRGIAQAPSVKAYGCRAYLHTITRQLTFATNDYRRALELDPDHHDSHANLAELYRVRGEIRKATEHLARCLELRPDQPTLLKQQASLLIRIKEYRRAIAASQAFERLVPTDLNAPIVQAVAHLELKETDAALAVVRRILARDSKHLPALLSLAQIQMALESWSAVVATCDRILNLKPRPTAKVLKRVRATRALALRRSKRSG